MKKNMKWLSNGSVISIKDARRRLMIVGRLQRGGDGTLFHYAGVLWPEGLISPNELYLFNQEDISILWFMGFQEAEEFHYRKILQNQSDSIYDQLM